MPCMSAGSAPSAAAHCGSRWTPNRAAAAAHWSLRWAVGATTTSRRGPSLSASRLTAAVRAKVVLPAPGVATARKSGSGQAWKRSRATFCQGRRRTRRVTGRAVERGAARGRRVCHGRGPPRSGHDGAVPWSVEASAARRDAARVADSCGATGPRPVHLLVALAEGRGLIADRLNAKGPIRTPKADADARVLTSSHPAEEVIRRQAAENLRLSRVSAAAEGFARELEQPVQPAHLLVAVLDEGGSDVRDALEANDLDGGDLRRAALQELGAPEDLPRLRMPDVRWAPLRVRKE